MCVCVCVCVCGVCVMLWRVCVCVWWFSIYCAKCDVFFLSANQLCAELSQFNLNLPARVCLPLYPPTHQVLRIPPSEAVVLNSKSKAPFLILVEVADVEDTFLSPLLQKQLDVSLTCSGLWVYYYYQTTFIFHNYYRSPEEAKAFVHSEGPSPANTRVCLITWQSHEHCILSFSRLPLYLIFVVVPVQIPYHWVLLIISMLVLSRRNMRKILKMR